MNLWENGQETPFQDPKEVSGGSFHNLTIKIF